MILSANSLVLSRRKMLWKHYQAAKLLMKQTKVEDMQKYTIEKTALWKKQAGKQQNLSK